MRKVFLLLASTFVLGACDSITESCSAVLSEGITLEVRDSLTNALVRHDTASSLLYRVNGGPLLSSSVIYPERLAIFGAGTFDLTLRRPGYRTWTKNDVVVPTNGGSCPQPVRVSLLARLVPL